MIVCVCVLYIATAEAVAEWQKLKEEGKLGAEEEEEDIYAEARMVDVSVLHCIVQLSCIYNTCMFV